MQDVPACGTAQMWYYLKLATHQPTILWTLLLSILTHLLFTHHEYPTLQAVVSYHR